METIPGLSIPTIPTGTIKTLNVFTDQDIQYRIQYDKKYKISKATSFFKPKELGKVKVFVGDYFIIVKISKSNSGFISPIYHCVNFNNNITINDLVYINTGNFLPINYRRCFKNEQN